jgi:hypothetical protein
MPPNRYLDDNRFYFQYQADKEIYRIFVHQDMTLAENLERISQWGFELLSEDEWEYMVSGGTRKLFRWGNTLKPTLEDTTQQNMFGIYIEDEANRFEITKDEEVLKLGVVDISQPQLEEKLIQSSYYQSYIRIQKEEKLSPMKYLYRKSLIIR